MVKNIEIIKKQINENTIEIIFSLKENHKQNKDGSISFDNHCGAYWANVNDTDEQIKQKVKELIQEQKQRKEAEKNKVETSMEIEFDE